MTLTRLSNVASFSPAKAAKAILAEGAHARVTLWCLEAGQDIHPHVHEGDHAWVVTEGEGWFLTADAEHPVSAGTFLFAPEGEAHGMRAKTRLTFVSVSAG